MVLPAQSFGMTDAAIPATLDSEKERDRHSYLEHRIFAYSPFGTLATSLLIFVGFAVAFVAAMSIDGRAIYAVVRGEFSLSDESRGALTLSLLIAVSLGLQRFARLKDLEDCLRYASSLKHNTESAMAHRRLAPANGLSVATGLGFLFAIVAMFTFIPHPPFKTLSFAWFLVTTVAVSVLFARGVVQTRAGAKALRQFIDAELVIDLLRPDRLTIVGRSAARAALIWFGVSAVLCLFFTSDGITLFTVLLVLMSVLLGMAIFVTTMGYMHKRIRDAKAVELEHVRTRMERLRHEAHESGDAAQRLSGLIAYEGRIAAAPEWPFDQTIAMRLGASALILTVPWFGQAVAGTLVERLGQLLH